MQAQPLPQTPALCHTMCRTVGNKQLQWVFKCVMQAQPLPQPPALCHTICSARNSRTTLAAGFAEEQAAAAVVQVCHAGSAATPTTCTMSHHVQDSGQQAAAADDQVCHGFKVVPVCYAGCPDKCTMSHHTQKGGQKKRNPLPKPPGSRHVKCACGIRKTICKKCNGGSLCTHGIQRQWCMRAECGGGAARCEHGTQRSKCLRCGGTGVCKHGKVRCRCLDCKEEEQNAKQQ